MSGDIDVFDAVVLADEAADLGVKKGINQTCDDLATLWELICNENPVLHANTAVGLDGCVVTIADLITEQLKDYKEKRGS